MMATAINPFPNDVRKAFQDLISAPGYQNKERIPYDKWHRIHVFLDNPQTRPDNPTDSRLKSRALKDFELISNKLYKSTTSQHPGDPRLVVPESEAFDYIVQEHLQLLHAGHDKVWAAI